MRGKERFVQMRLISFTAMRRFFLSQESREFHLTARFNSELEFLSVVLITVVQLISESADIGLPLCLRFSTSSAVKARRSWLKSNDSSSTTVPHSEHINSPRWGSSISA